MNTHGSYPLAYTRSELLYRVDNYYKWTTPSDRENTYYISGADDTELDRTEGYEILYFINHLIKKYWPTHPPTIRACIKMERMIRYEVPATIISHKKIESWILMNWLTVK
jgi:hypothetical protein